MRFRFAPALLLACLAFIAGQPAWAVEPPAHVALRPVINMLSGPREDADVVSQTTYGARLLEQDRKDGWVKVQTDDAYLGWVPQATLRGLKDTERYPASTEPGRIMAVDALAANVYLEPDTTRHAPTLVLPYGVRLERVNGGKDTPRWLEVRLPDDRRVWIQTGDVRTDLKPLSLEASLDLARRFLGVTYTWGGASSFGFDCSGFTQTILRSRGIIMPRDSRIQAAWSGLVPVAERELLQPGDLLFFGKEPARITHTGIYLGKGTFIHDAPQFHPRVQITELNDPSWSKLLVAMRRLK